MIIISVSTHSAVTSNNLSLVICFYLVEIVFPHIVFILSLLIFLYLCIILNFIHLFDFIFLFSEQDFYLRAVIYSSL